MVPRLDRRALEFDHLVEPPAARVTRITESPAEDDAGEGFRPLPMG